MDIFQSNSIIKVENLTKRFKNLVAVDNISFQVEKGELFAFLGPNGAGKTTTIKMLITLLKPNSGVAIVDGCSIIHEPAKVRKVIGYVPQMISVDGTLTAYENLMLMARLYDIPSRERKQRIAETLSFLDLEKSAKSLVRTFSGGMVRKLEVGQAMLHRPRVLFLDEPTAGLDPIAKRNVWAHLQELKRSFNTTIFFTTHNMDEAEEVSDKVAIIKAGKIAAIGTVTELKEKTQKPDATLEDVFIYFTGTLLQEEGNIRDIRRARRTEKRLG
jgi:ABC-2 type transport system ATP-binding protein